MDDPDLDFWPVGATIVMVNLACWIIMICYLGATGQCAS